jgi:protein-tyrosine phosphatase
MQTLCELCDVELATVRCEQCDMVLCTVAGCDGDLHAPKSKQKHRRVAVKSSSSSSSSSHNSKTGALLCELCEESTAIVHCAACDMSLCAGNASCCNEMLHKPKSKQAHKRTAIASGAAAAAAGAASAATSTAATAAENKQNQSSSSSSSLAATTPSQAAESIVTVSGTDAKHVQQALAALSVQALPPIKCNAAAYRAEKAVTNDELTSCQELYNMLNADGVSAGIYRPRIHDSFYMSVLDLRDAKAWQAAHVVTSMGFAMPSTLDALIQKINMYCDAWPQMIVCYDADGKALDGDKGNTSHPSKTFLDALMQASDQGDIESIVYYVQGGFAEFQRLYPFMCSKGKKNDPLHSAVVSMPSEIMPGALYLGSFMQAQHYETFQRLGCAFSVNMACETTNRFSDGNKHGPVQYLKAPSSVQDKTDSKTSEAFLAFCTQHAFKFIDALLLGTGDQKDKKQKKQTGRVLVSCANGISRGPALCIAYLMHRERICLRDAFDRVKAARSCVAPNNGLLEALSTLEARIMGAQFDATDIDDLFEHKLDVDQIKLPCTVLPNLLWSAHQATAFKKELMQALHIGTIVNCAAECSNAFPAAFHYVHVKLAPSSKTALLPHFDAVFKLLDKARKTSIVMLHCSDDASRTQTLLVAYLMHKHSGAWSLERAFLHMKQLKQDIRFDRMYVACLAALEKRLLPKNASLTNIERMKAQDPKVMHRIV